MKATTVIRTYSAGFMSVTALVAFMSFTQPVKHTERPDEVQRNLYAHVPSVEEGPPPRAVGTSKGEALAYIRIPRFGPDWLWTISEGTDMNVLANGPGHFVDTALPGAEGNSAYAAHRSGHGDPFLDFEELRPGDRIIVAQNGGEWTYEVLFEPRIIEPSEDWVVHQELPWGAPRLTLTTCWPKYGSEKRMYVRAKLVQ